MLCLIQMLGVSEHFDPIREFSYIAPLHTGGQYNMAGGYPGPQQMPGYSVPGQQILNDPMANMAMSYGHNLAGQGREYVQQNVSVIYIL